MGVSAGQKGLLSYKEQSREDPKFSEAVADDCGGAVNADLRKQQGGIFFLGILRQVFKGEVRMVKTSSVESEHCFASGNQRTV